MSEIDIDIPQDTNTIEITTPTATEETEVQAEETQNNTSYNVGGDAYYTDLAKDWAIKMNGKVLGQDYSSKYYAYLAQQIEGQVAQDTEDAQIWAEGTDAQVQALGGEHSSKGWVNYVLTNPPEAYVTQTQTGCLLTVTDINGTTTAELLNGQDGAPGTNGTNGTNGTDGQDGADGFSPIATVTKSGDTATISITDKNGTTTATISDGQDQPELTFSTGLTDTNNIITVTDYAKLIKNTATGTNSLTLLGTATGEGISINIGSSSKALGEGCIAIGADSSAGASGKGGSIAIGSGNTTSSGRFSIAMGYYAVSSADEAIQIGYGTNSTANSLNIGFYNNSTTHYNWQLLDGATGLIPDARISTNIARTVDIPTQASDINALPDSTKYGKSIDLSLNTTDYKLTLTLKDQDGTILNSKTVDFPIESVVVNGSYDSTNKKIVLTLQNGNTIDVPVGDLVAGLQTEITSSNKLSADLVDDTSTTHKFVTAEEKAKINSALQIPNPAYGTSTTAASTAEKVVSIPEITELKSGQIIVVSPTKSATVADLTIKLNNFTAYPILYAGSAITTSTDNLVWNANQPSAFIFNGSNWLFLCHGLDSNTTYSTMSVEEGVTGTATSNRSLQAVNLKQIIQGTTLTDLSIATASTVLATDSITDGIGKLQAQINALPAIPTNISAFTNDAGYIKSAALNGYATQTWVGQQGYLTSSALNGYATENFVISQGYITGITNNDVITALGYTPYNSSNPNGYITSSALTPYALISSLATVATSGSYNDLSDKPYIPSGVIVDQTFDGTSANAQSGVAIAAELGNYLEAQNNKITYEYTNQGGNTKISYLDTNSQVQMGLEIGEGTYGNCPSLYNFNPSEQLHYAVSLQAEDGFAGLELYFENPDTGTESDVLLSTINNTLAINGDIVATVNDIPDTSNLANNDLSNLSATGEAKFQSPISDLATIRTQATNGQTAYNNMEGAWVSSGLQIVNNVSVNYATNYSLNLSSYLPTDDLYEVAITGRATSGSTSGDLAVLHLSISSYPANVFICEARTRTSSTNQNTGSCIIMVKRTDTIQIVRDTAYRGNVSLWLLKYRRVR